MAVGDKRDSRPAGSELPAMRGADARPRLAAVDGLPSWTMTTARRRAIGAGVGGELRPARR
jgi:hypothetical protein